MAKDFDYSLPPFANYLINISFKISTRPGGRGESYLHELVLLPSLSPEKGHWDGYRFYIPKLKGVEPDIAFRDERYKAITLNERNIPRCSFWWLTFVDNFHKILWDLVRLFLLWRNLALGTFWCVAAIPYSELIYVQVRTLKVVTK